MPEPKDILGHIHGGRVLDVATGAGGFIHFLLDGLQDYREIIGVDIKESAATAFAEAFKDRPNIRFEAMDALHLQFEDGSFDLVSISNSLHHFEDPRAVLGETLRVLRPGGTLLVAEMYCDGQSETQMTHVHLHHWWGAVDRLGGTVHRETFRREQLVEMVAGTGLAGTVLHDLSDPESDPRDPALVQELEPVFERYLQRAEGHPELQERGAELRRRVEEIGFHSATTLVMLGMKS
jgi:ubiquinone/menaquinone biosynthesis C-methylase UbiE